MLYHYITYIYIRKLVFILGLCLYTVVFGSFSVKNVKSYSFPDFCRHGRSFWVLQPAPTKLGPSMAKNIYKDPK